MIGNRFIVCMITCIVLLTLFTHFNSLWIHLIFATPFLIGTVLGGFVDSLWLTKMVAATCIISGILGSLVLKDMTYIVFSFIFVLIIALPLIIGYIIGQRLLGHDW